MMLLTDKWLIQNLEQAKEAVLKDWDMIFVIDGIEGSGKSVLAQQCAHSVDPTLNIDRIAFTDSEFKEIIKKAEPRQAVIYDEAYGGLSARQTLSKTNKALVSMLAEIRQKNLFVFVVMPCFFELDRYVSLWRSRVLLHVYVGDGFERGKFMFFSHNKKKNLWINGKKFYSYARPAADFIGRFSNKYAVDEKAYRKKKLDALNRHGEEEELGRLATRQKRQRDAMIYGLIEEKMFKQSELLKFIKKYGANISKPQISEIYRNFSLENDFLTGFTG